MTSGTEGEVHQLSCLEVWGGNQHISALVELPGLMAWVESAPYEHANGGGDLHYMSACDHGVVARIALADVSGHGPAVSTIAVKLRDLMRHYVNYWDQTEFVRGLNDAFPKEESELKYASAVILGYYTGSGELLFTNAGHPAPLWYHAQSREWGFLREDAAEAKKVIEGLPLGIIAGTSYQQTAVQLAPGDMLVMYTDGLSETDDASGRELGSNGILNLARTMPVHSPSALGSALLEAVRSYRHGPANDDETLLVVQRQGASPAASP